MIRAIIKVVGALGFILLTQSSLFAQATTPCQLISRTCVEPQETRFVGGFPIFKECWRYESVFECTDPESRNECANLNFTECVQTSSACQVVSPIDGTCKTLEQSYTCTDPVASAGVHFVNQVDTVNETWDTAVCDELNANAACNFVSQQCDTVDDTRRIGYADVFKSCWLQTEKHACEVGGTENDCQEHIDNGCVQTDVECYAWDNEGACTAQEYTYECETPGEDTTVMDCEGQTFCLDGECFDSGYSPDEDFLGAVVNMEAARQAGAYFENVEIFKGDDGRCKKALFGLVDCCKNANEGGGTSNSAMGEALGFATDNLGNALGSSYVHDALFTSASPDFLVDTYQLFYGSGDGFSLGIDFYGVSVSWVNGSFAFGFDPTTFAIKIGILILTKMFECDQQEGLLAMRKDQGLCTKRGTWCSLELDLLFTSICLEKTTSYCCWNSQLAKIVANEGKAQLGMDWGTVQSPDCSGFLPDQFELIDFTQIDMSKFYGHIKPDMPNKDAVRASNEAIIQQKLEEYYNQ